jgi:ubiquinone/menaquinone biosynthesis C-methylase UbiE
MVHERVPETNEGIQGHFDVEQYDLMMRKMVRERKEAISSLRKAGMASGSALEVGPGPGYFGIDWLKATQGTALTGIEISQEMIRMAKKNADREGVTKRAEYVAGNAMHMPFNDNAFDLVISNGSLHEWEKPGVVFKEILRVLKPNGQFFVSDLKRDAPWYARMLMCLMVKPKTMKPGLISSLNAAYTYDEIHQILRSSGWSNPKINQNPFGLNIFGKKPA